MLKMSKIIGIFGNFENTGPNNQYFWKSFVSVKTCYDCHIHDVRHIHNVKTKKLFFSASKRPRTVLNAFLECMYLANVRHLAQKCRILHRYFRTLPKFSKFSAIPKLLKYQNRIFSRKLPKPKPLFIFDRFLTVEIPVRLIFAKDWIMKISGQRIALDPSQKIIRVKGFEFFKFFQFFFQFFFK